MSIHYASLGNSKKQLIIFIHGFPDFWYSWRDVMPALSEDYFTVAIDQRGYNLSDKPKGEENYDMKFLVRDVVSVIHHLGFKKAIVVGHDWGGAVAWEVAMRNPESVERLIILNLPHVRGLKRELANNPAQQKSSQYARFYQQKTDAFKVLTAEKLTDVIFPEKQNSDMRKKYLGAFGRSDFEAMVAYSDVIIQRSLTQLTLPM